MDSFESKNMKKVTIHKIKRFLSRRGVTLLFIAATIFIIPSRWCMMGSGRAFDGDGKFQGSLARGVEKWIHGENRLLSPDSLQTGYELFNGEWLFGTYFMAGMGYGQTALEHPEWKKRHAALMTECVDNILDERVSEFDTDSWNGQSALSDLEDGTVNHAAFFGYTNLLLSLVRMVEPDSKYAELNDRITAALKKSLSQSPIGLIATYPGEYYPVDNCAVAGSIGLHGRATGTDHTEFLETWTRSFRERYIDPESGLLIQAVSGSSGLPIDQARGSGTALGAYMISFSDRKLGRELFLAVKRELADTILGFGVIREYPEGIQGKGDIDSGPLILGYGISPTGFTLGLSRIYGDRDLYRRIFATSDLFGTPISRRGNRNYILGGSLGDAIMFAMLTAPPGQGGDI